MKCNFAGHSCQNYEDYVNGNCPNQCDGPCNYMGYSARKIKDAENLYLTTPDAECYTSSIKFDVPIGNTANSNTIYTNISVLLIFIQFFFTKLIF
jgi:hypothetical protein